MTKLQSKLNTTLNQWKEIHNNEMKISEDLRKHNEVHKAESMILKLEAMIKEAE